MLATASPVPKSWNVAANPMVDRSYRVLLWTLVLFGLSTDLASKYGVFSWLYNQGLGDEAVVIPHCWEFMAQFTGETDTEGPLSPLRTTFGTMPVLPRVNHGALFGLAQKKGWIANGIFAGVSIAAALAIAYWSTLRSTVQDPLLCGALGLILAAPSAISTTASSSAESATSFTGTTTLGVARVQRGRLLPGVRRRPAAGAGLLREAGRGAAAGGIGGRRRRAVRFEEAANGAPKRSSGAPFALCCRLSLKWVGEGPFLSLPVVACSPIGSLTKSRPSTVVHRSVRAPGQGCCRYFFGGGVAFTGAGFAPFFGFFFSLPCELLPFPITRTSVGSEN